MLPVVESLKRSVIVNHTASNNTAMEDLVRMANDIESARLASFRNMSTIENYSSNIEETANPN